MYHSCPSKIKGTIEIKAFKCWDNLRFFELQSDAIWMKKILRYSSCLYLKTGHCFTNNYFAPDARVRLFFPLKYCDDTKLFTPPVLRWYYFLGFRMTGSREKAVISISGIHLTATRAHFQSYYIGWQQLIFKWITELLEIQTRYVSAKHAVPLTALNEWPLTSCL